MEWKENIQKTRENKKLTNRVGSSSLFIITISEWEERKCRAQAIFEKIVNIPKLTKISSHILSKHLIPIRIKLCIYTHIHIYAQFYSVIYIPIRIKLHMYTYTYTCIKAHVWPKGTARHIKLFLK